MKAATAILATLLFTTAATSHAGIISFTRVNIDFTNPSDTKAKATWSAEPGKITVSKDGLGWDGESASSQDGWVQTKPVAVGLSWRPTYCISARVAIAPPPKEITLKNGQKSTYDAGEVYVRYSPDRKHWSSWQVLQRSKPQSIEEKKTPGRYYGGEIRVSYHDRREYDKLVYDYQRLDVPWKSDEEATVQWILRRDPEIFSKHIPFIGYVEFLFEASFPGGQPIRSFRADIVWSVGGIHYPAKDEAIYKDRQSTPWRFETRENTKTEPIAPTTGDQPLHPK